MYENTSNFIFTIFFKKLLTIQISCSIISLVFDRRQNTIALTLNKSAIVINNLRV